MTTGGSGTASTHEDELLAHLYQQVTDRQGARYAATYDVHAGLTRFNGWLREHTITDGVGAAIKAGADTIPVGFWPVPAAPDWSADRSVTDLYAVHYRALVRLAFLLGWDVPTAEEVIQDAFVALAESWHRLRDTDEALAYLRQTVVNRSRSALRPPAVADGNAYEAPPALRSAGQEALALPERSAVVAALSELPSRQREAIVLRYYADLSEAEIASTMRISRGAVRSHMARGLAALRAVL